MWPFSSVPTPVDLYTSPWVSNMRAAAYFGVIVAELFLPDDEVHNRRAAWTKAELELLESLRDKARLFGANAVVGLEIHLDPFFVTPAGATGLHLHAIGTAALLEPLF